MSQTRLPKFRRVPEAVSDKRVTERGLEIIRTILRYRLISTGTLVRVVGGNEDVTYRHLQRLYHQGLVSRFTLPRRGNPGEFIYFLENVVALREIAHRLGDAPVDWKHIHRNREKFGEGSPISNGDGFGKFLFVRHELMISDFHAGAELGCKTSNGRTELERWVQTSELWDRVRMPSKHTLPHRPDAFFTLRFPLAPEGQQRSNFFYEADRGTTNMTRFGLKLTAYLEYLKQNKQTVLGIRRVRAVLVQTTSTARLEECLATVSALAKKEPLFGSVFWFGVETLPTQDVLKIGWIAPGHASLRTLAD